MAGIPGVGKCEFPLLFPALLHPPPPPSLLPSILPCTSPSLSLSLSLSLSVLRAPSGACGAAAAGGSVGRHGALRVPGAGQAGSQRGVAAQCPSARRLAAAPLGGAHTPRARRGPPGRRH